MSNVVSRLLVLKIFNIQTKKSRRVSFTDVIWQVQFAWLKVNIDCVARDCPILISWTNIFRRSRGEYIYTYIYTYIYIYIYIYVVFSVFKRFELQFMLSLCGHLCFGANFEIKFQRLRLERCSICYNFLNQRVIFESFQGKWCWC